MPTVTHPTPHACSPLSPFLSSSPITPFLRKHPCIVRYASNHSPCILYCIQAHHRPYRGFTYVAPQHQYRAQQRPRGSSPHCYHPTMLKLLTCVAILEKEKQRNLSRRPHKTSTPIPDVPGRNDHLASTSEASVKARPFPASSTLAHVYSYHLTFLAQTNRHSSNPHIRLHTSKAGTTTSPMRRQTSARCRTSPGCRHSR